MQITVNIGLTPELTTLMQSIVSALRAMAVTDEPAATSFNLGDASKAVRGAFIINAADQPDAGADAPSGAPLVPPAPSTAAADLFPSAPAALQDGAAASPSVPAPPVPSAPPVAAPSAAAAPANLVNVDSDGLPWDERIHSGSREKNKDGTWRRRRNLDDAELARVTQELRGIMAIPVGGLTIPAGEAPPFIAHGAVPPAPMVNAGAPAEQAPNVPPVPAPATSAPAIAATPTPPAPPAPTATAPSAPATGNPFSQLMTKITSNVAGGRLTEAQVHQALVEQGLQPNQIAHLAARHDLAANVSARLDVFLAGGV